MPNEHKITQNNQKSQKIGIFRPSLYSKADQEGPSTENASERKVFGIKNQTPKTKLSANIFLCAFPRYRKGPEKYASAYPCHPSDNNTETSGLLGLVYSIGLGGAAKKEMAIIVLTKSDSSFVE